jgi:hypothetical protein
MFDPCSLVVDGNRSYAERMPKQFNGVKVFSATMIADRQRLGDTVTGWLSTHTVDIVDLVVTQSSDASFHCIALTLFYWENRA